MRADVNNEGAGRDLDLVGAEQEQRVERAGGRHLARIQAVVGGHKTEIEARRRARLPCAVRE